MSNPLVKCARLFLVAAALTVVGIMPALASGSHESSGVSVQTRSVLRQPKSPDSVLRTGLPAITQSGTVEFLTPWLQPAAKRGDLAFKSLFEKYYPRVKVDFGFMNQSKLLTVASSRLVTGNPPAATGVALGTFMLNFAKEGALVDLTSIWKRYGLEKLIPPGIASTAEYHGKYYAIPLLIAPQNFLWWNKKLFKEAGLPQPPYKSWNEFFTVGRKFEARMHMPFVSMGLVPAIYAFNKTFYLGAKRYGTAMAFRILNGNATKADFTHMLQFSKKYMSFASPGAASLAGNAGPPNEVAAGKAAVCMEGQWGRNAFAKQGMVLGKDYGMAYLPGPPIMYYNSGGLMIFKGSGKEQIGKAMAAVAATEQAQIDFSEKGTIPARNNVPMSPKIFPPPAIVGAKEMKIATQIPIPIIALPAPVEQGYSPEVVSYLVGSTDLQATVQQFMSLQEKYKTAFVTKWGP